MGRILDAAVDDYKRGVDEQRMDRSLIPSHPKYIRKRAVFESKFVERMSQEEWDFFPLF